MAIRYDRSAPTGWGVDETTGKMAKVPTGYVQQGNLFVAPTSSPAPTPTVAPPPTPTAPTVAPTPTPVASDYSTYTGQSTPKAPPAGYSSISIDQNDPQSYQRMADQYDIIATPYAEGGIIKTAYYGKPIQYNYMVDAAGNRKKVRLDDSAGMAAAFAAGYKAETSAGVPSGNNQIVTPSGAIDQSQMKKATLRKVNADGSVQRVVVTVGSSDAQKYFGQGFTLETAAQAPDVAVTMKAPDGSLVAAKNKAQATDLMAKGYTPVTVANNTPVTTPANVVSRTENGAMSNVQTQGDANKVLNESQSKDKAAIDSGEVPTRGNTGTTDSFDWSAFGTSGSAKLGTTQTDLAIIDALKSATTAKAPDLPSMEQAYGDLTKQYGVDAIRSQIDDLTKQEQDIQTSIRTRKAAEQSRPVDLSLAAGRVSEIERQENERLDAVQRQKDYLVNSYNSKMSTIQNLMTYKQTDYKNATDAFNTQYDRNIKAIDLIEGINNDQKSWADKDRDDARAQWQIYANSIGDGTMDISRMTSAQKMDIVALEVRAGIPTGTLAMIKPDAKANIIATTNSVENGNQYLNILYRNSDGTTRNEQVKLGEDPNVIKNANKLDAQAQTRVDKIVGQFDGEPIVKNYNTVLEGYNFVKALPNDSKNPADDQALIYAFAKAMDPNSVVREGEYATVQKYSQSWVSSFGFNAMRVVDNGEFLTPEARANMKSVIEKKYSVLENQYTNVYKEYARRVNLITGSEDGADYLTDYRGAAGGSGNSSLGSDLDSLFGGSGPSGGGGSLDNVLDGLGFKGALGTAKNYPNKGLSVDHVGSAGITDLGSLSQKYESRGNPGAVGYDNTGGWSYGTYQLAFNNAEKFINQSRYADDFAGLQFNSKAWRNKWQEVAQNDPQGFGAAQHEYISKMYYQPQIQKLASAGLNVDALGLVMKDVIWSTAVQHGSANNIVLNVLKNAKPSDTEEDLVKKIYESRWNGGRNFARSTADVRAGVKNRFFGTDGELNEALARLDQSYA